MHIKWQDKLPDCVVLNSAGIPRIDIITYRCYHRLYGQNTYFPCKTKTYIKASFMMRCRSVNDTKVTWRSAPKTHSRPLKLFVIDPDTWESAARDRTTWRTTLRKCEATYEDSRTLDAEHRKHKRKPIKWSVRRKQRFLVITAHERFAQWTHRSLSQS